MMLRDTERGRGQQYADRHPAEACDGPALAASEPAGRHGSAAPGAGRRGHRTRPSAGAAFAASAWLLCLTATAAFATASAAPHAAASPAAPAETAPAETGVERDLSAVSVEAVPEREHAHAEAIAPDQPIASRDDDASARPERQALINAATDEAVARLLAKIEAEPIRPGLTVGRFLDEFDAATRRELRQFLRQSPQIGGPRFVAGRGVQVQLQVRGEAVAEKLVEIASVADRQSPLPAEQLATRLQSWSGRNFVATGVSIAPELAPLLRPTGSEPHAEHWAGIDPAASRAAIDAARGDAAAKIFAAARPVVLHDQPAPARQRSSEAAQAARTDTDAVEEPVAPSRAYTLGDAFDTGTFGEQNRQWLEDRPVTRVRFLPDRVVELRLSVDEAMWVQEMRGALAELDVGLPMLDEEQWRRVSEELSRLLPAEPIGRAVAVEGGADFGRDEPRGLAALLPEAAPAWTRRPLRAEGQASADAGRTPLLVARVAEDAARRNLRDRLAALPINDGTTLGDLAESEEQVARMLDETVRDAQVIRSDYRPEGEVAVTISVSTATLWQNLRGLR